MMLVSKFTDETSRNSDIPESGRHRERMAFRTVSCQDKYADALETNTYGGMREISVLEPLPGDVGLTKVVSMRVQPSPLKPQPPSIEGKRTSNCIFPSVG